jgi:hypothetical protein
MKRQQRFIMEISMGRLKARPVPDQPVRASHPLINPTTIPDMGGSINIRGERQSVNEETPFQILCKAAWLKTIRNIFTEPLSAGRRPITSLHPDHG